MNLVRITLYDGDKMLINMDQVRTMKFGKEEDADGDCPFSINEKNVGHVHGSETAERIEEKIFSICGKGKSNVFIDFDEEGYEAYKGDLWDV